MGRNHIEPNQLRALAAKVRLLALDVDGVLTDGRLHFDAKGKECKVFHARDGYGIRRTLDAGVEIAVISGRKSIAVEKRTSDLGIKHVYLGIGDKPGVLNKLLKICDCNLDEVAYVGDDMPDIECMKLVGLAIAVADAHEELDAVADWHTVKGGGQGAVREVCDLLLSARGALENN
jgi:3-deoxy-D-manno-octulosonate 8-phosphate phosphatase (KDO 8-P phosphatase)